MPENQHSFYLLSELLISLIGAFLLLAIWFAVQKNFKQKLASEISIKRLDKGLLYISLSVFVWAFSSFVTIIFPLFFNYFLKFIIYIKSLSTKIDPTNKKLAPALNTPVFDISNPNIATNTPDELNKN